MRLRYDNKMDIVDSEKSNKEVDLGVTVTGGFTLDRHIDKKLPGKCLTN